MSSFNQILKILLISSLFISCGRLAEKRLHKTHNALFETFFPLEKISEPEIKKLALEKRDAMWITLKKRDHYKSLLFSILKIKNLMDLKKGETIYREYTFEPEKLEELEPWNIVWVDEFLKSKKTKGRNPYFYKLSFKERRLLINLLVNSKINLHRRIGFVLRNIFLSQIFQGKLAEKLSGVKQEEIYRDELPFLPPFKSQLLYNSEKKEIEGNLDYIIVGGSSASSILASGLQAKGKRVLLLEPHKYFSFGSTRLDDGKDSTGFIADNDGSLLIELESLGRLNERPSLYSFSPERPYISKRIKSWGIKNFDLKAGFKEVNELFSPSYWPKQGQTKLDEIFKLGLKSHLDTFPEYLKVNNIMANNRSNKKDSMMGRLYAGLVHSENPLEALFSAQAVRVLRDIDNRKKVNGVIFKMNAASGLNQLGVNIPLGTEITAFAKNVILSAGSYDDFSILKESSIKHLDKIGKSISAQPYVTVQAEFDYPVLGKVFSEGSFTDYYIEQEGTNFLLLPEGGYQHFTSIITPNFELNPLENLKRASYHAKINVNLLEETNEENRLEIKLGGPLLFHKLSQSDRIDLAFGVAEAARILLSAGARRVYLNSFEYAHNGGEFTPENFLSKLDQIESMEDYLEFTPNKTLIMSNYLSGGNRIGNSPKTSVVNQEFKMWGIEGLYIVDESVFPTSIGPYFMDTVNTLSYHFLKIHN